MSHYNIFLIAGILAISCAFQIEVQKDELPTHQLELNAECNTTYFEYQSLDKISNNSYMNLTFNKVLYIDGTQFTYINQISYTINSQSQVTFSYDDSNQTASYGQNNDILIEGDRVKFNINFAWYKNQTGSISKGIGKVNGLTQKIPFTIRNSQTAYGFLLNQVAKFSVYSIYLPYEELICMSPANCTLTESDKFAIFELMAGAIDNVTSISQILENNVNGWLNSTLAKKVCCQNSESVKAFEYKWTNTNGTESFSIERNYRNSYIDKIGQNSGYYESADLIVKDFNDSQCGPQPGNKPLEKQKYGGSQEFISLKFIQNLMRSAIQKGSLNSILNRTTWPNYRFNFTAEQLAQYLQNINERFNPDADVYGNCRAIDERAELLYVQDYSFQASFTHLCELFIDETKVLGFKMLYSLGINTSFTYDATNALEFKIGNWAFQKKFDDSFGFKVINQYRAGNLLSDIFETIKKNTIFGSGWPMFMKRKFPSFLVTKTALVIYDRNQS